ncbi:MAG TPA: hemolysin III family protein [Clostridia bacterium]|nr:hemolysin III family protein [Clostridia bacterium]
MHPTREQAVHFSEEIANSVTHGIGLLLSIAGLVVLVVLAALRGTAWHVVSCSVYGATLVLLYLSSTLYHTVQGPRVKRVFRVFDHSAIYLLIAGTYTPFTLIHLRGPLGWSLFGTIWGLTILGIVFKTFAVDAFAILSTALYIVMGWLAVLGIRPLLHALNWHGFLWLLGGGMFYTIGVIFFASQRRYAHAVWHLFVLGGSVCHYFAIVFYVIPPRA